MITTDYISINQAAEKYGFNKATMRSWFTGRSKSVDATGVFIKLGNRVYIHRERFEKWLDGHAPGKKS